MLGEGHVLGGIHSYSARSNIGNVVSDESLSIPQDGLDSICMIILMREEQLIIYGGRTVNDNIINCQAQLIIDSV